MSVEEEREQSNLQKEHPLKGDGRTLFYPEAHLYVHDGLLVRTSVTAVLKKYWPEFDAEGVVDSNFAQWRGSRNHKYHPLIRYLELVQLRDHAFCKEAVRLLWEAEAERASEEGTRMHHHFQCMVERWPLPDGETAEVRTFRRWLANFCTRYDLSVWRSEWIVVHEEQGVAVVAGQIDLLLKSNSSNSYWAVDYKRTNPAPKYAGGPRNLLGAQMTSFEGGSGPFKELRATDFNKYTSQLNAYAYIAHANYGVDFRDRMFLVQIHPDLPEAHCVQVRRMDEEMQHVFGAEVQDALLEARRSP